MNVTFIETYVTYYVNGLVTSAIRYDVTYVIEWDSFMDGCVNGPPGWPYVHRSASRKRQFG